MVTRVISSDAMLNIAHKILDGVLFITKHISYNKTLVVANNI